jgi:hypothetical protein
MQPEIYLTTKCFQPKFINKDSVINEKINSSKRTNLMERIFSMLNLCLSYVLVKASSLNASNAKASCYSNYLPVHILHLILIVRHNVGYSMCVLYLHHSRSADNLFLYFVGGSYNITVEYIL